MKERTDEAVMAFWTARARLGERSGTDDVNLDALELRFLGPRARRAPRVLDAGCGNGRALAALAPFGHCVGFDAAPAMIEAARGLTTGPSTRWEVHDLRDPIPLSWGLFDLVYTKRSLINLASWKEQRQAIHHLVAAVRRGGSLVLVEASQDSLDRLNHQRGMLQLEPIARPWHNRYLQEDEVLGTFNHLGPVLVPFTDVYYFFSRIVNASVASAEGRAPAYDDPINRAVLGLPMIPMMGVGQTVAWVFQL